MLKAFKYKLEPTRAQAVMLSEWEGICRLVWNNALEQRRLWLKRGRWINYSSKSGSGIPNQSEQLTEAKKDPELAFLRSVPSQILQQTLMDLERTCRMHSVWRTHFKTKRNPRGMGMRFPAGKNIEVQRKNKKHATIKLPKLGIVKLRYSRPLSGVIRSATLVREGTVWFVSILIDTLTTPTTTHANPFSSVGVDRGIAIPVACSDGINYSRIFFTDKERRRYKNLQQKLARQRKKGGANRKKTLHAMGKLRKRETNRRVDFLNKTAHTLTHQFELICVEDLRIKNMSKSAKGTIDAPGKNVKQKSGLNRSILEKGWGLLITKLEHKALETGSTIIKVDPKHTSTTCSNCGSQHKEYRENQAVFHCHNCGTTLNADLNAAINIRTRGQRGISLDKPQPPQLVVSQEPRVTIRKEKHALTV